MRKALGVLLLLTAAACLFSGLRGPVRPAKAVPPAPPDRIRLIAGPKTAAEKIVNGAKTEVVRRVAYDASYRTIPYPNGDVAQDRGACTDVITRALRCAGHDLQKLIHDDMERNFGLYPKKWGLSRPDSNIDHRRVPNHIVFMKRFAQELPRETTGEAKKTWKAGDLVYWNLASGGPTHCGVVSDEVNGAGLPLVVHNIGPYASQDDCLDSWEIIGHFRYPR